MEVEVLATLLGVALAALVAACGAGFRWLRSDLRDLRSHVDTRFEEQTANTNAQFASVGTRLDGLEARFDRLEAKVDNLIMALARAGSLNDPQLATPQPSSLPPETGPVLRPPDPTPTPTDAPESRALPAETPPETADPPRAPPTTGVQPSADQPAQQRPPEPFGPTAAPA